MYTLNQYDLILPENKTSNREILESFFRDNDISLKAKFQVTTTEILLKLVMKDYGIGYFFKRSVQDLIDAGELVEIKLEKPLPKMELVIGYNRQCINEPTKAFLQKLKAYFSPKAFDAP